MSPFQWQNQRQTQTGGPATRTNSARVKGMIPTGAAALHMTPLMILKAFVIIGFDKFLHAKCSRRLESQTWHSQRCGRTQIPPLGKGGSPPQLLLLGSHGKHSWGLNLVCHTCMVSMRLVPHVAKTKKNNIALGDMRESKCGGWLMP